MKMAKNEWRPATGDSAGHQQWATIDGPPDLIDERLLTDATVIFSDGAIDAINAYLNASNAPAITSHEVPASAKVIEDEEDGR